MARVEPDPARRILVGAYCANCGTAYTMLMERGWTWAPVGYCSYGCDKRAKKKRQELRCPSGCGRAKRPNALVCRDCWMTITGMCRGKRPLTETKSRQVERTKTWRAVWCRVCGWWHNTSHPVDDPDALIEEVGRILEAIRKIKGQVWINEMIESWNSDQYDRRAWKTNAA